MFKTSYTPLDGLVVYKEHQRAFLREAEMKRLARIAQPPKARLSFTLLTKIWGRISTSKPRTEAPTLEVQSRPTV